MVFAEIVIRKTERNKNQSKQNEQSKTIIQKTYKTENKKKQKEKKNKNKKKESLDGSVSLQIIKKPDQIKYKQTNKQKIARTATLKKATRKQEIKESPGFQWSRFQRKR